MASTKNKPGFIKQRVYDEPIGPEYPKASTDGPNQPKPVYDRSIGPNKPPAQRPFTDWNEPPAGPVNSRGESMATGKHPAGPAPEYNKPIGPSQPGGVEAPAEASAKGFFTELGQLMKKWGAPPEALGKIAPVASQLFRFVAPVGLAMGVASEAKRDLPGVVSALTPRSFDDVPDTLGGSPFEKWYTSAPDNPMKFLSGDTTQNAAAEPTQQPSEAAPAEVAQQPQAQPSEAPTAAESQARETDTGRDATVEGKDALPKEGDVPEFLFQPGTKGKEIPVEPDKPATKAAPAKASAKQDKPLSNEDIVAWNAQHNPGFKQDAGTASFQPAQGPKQSDGILFVGNQVYMADPRSPDGYKLIHSYGQGNGQ